MPIDAAADPHTRCGQAVADALRNKTSPALPAGAFPTVYELAWEGNHTNISYPCVVVGTAGPLPELYEPGGNDYTDVGYPVWVSLMDNESRFAEMEAKYHRWRYAASRLLNGLPLEGVAESIRCVIEPFAVEWDQQAYQHFRTGFVLRCWCRIPVGL